MPKQEGMENTNGGVNISNPLFPLEYFPARVNRVKVTAQIMPVGGVASGAFDPKSNVAYIPIGQAARDRAVRRHEASHANLLPITEMKMTVLFQGVEDMRIHTLAYPYNNDSSRRDELVFALVDLRNTVRLVLPDLAKMPPAQQRHNLILVVRALAILHYGVTNRRGCESKSPEARVAKMIGKIVTKYEKVLGFSGLQDAITKAVKALEHDDVVKATKIMRPFLTINNKDANAQKPQQGQGKSQPKQNDKKDKNQKPSQAPLSAEDDEEEKQEEKKESKKKSAPKEDKEKSKSDKKESGKSDKKDEKEKTDKSDKKAEEEDEDDPAESGDESDSGSESDEDSEDESEEEESGDAGDESDEDGDSEGDSEGSDESDEAGDEQGEDVPCDQKSAQPEGTKGGIGDCGAGIEQAIEDGRITSESLAMLDPETIKDLLKYHGENSLPTMKIHRLDYRMSKKITEGIDYRLAHSGSRINIGRIPRIFDPKPGKIFERIGQQQGGTVLIDASGSMNLDHERLSRLAENLPIGQIAYYNGGCNYDERGNHFDGALVIYSKDGRSFKLEAGEPLPDIYGSNTVDFQALQWLLKQPAPRWLISDNHFCGACTTEAATELAQRSYARKLITFFATLGELEISLHMRNELDDHDKSMFKCSGGDNLLKKLTPCLVCHGQGQMWNPAGGYWSDGVETKPCEACNGTGIRKVC